MTRLWNKAFQAASGIALISFMPADAQTQRSGPPFSQAVRIDNVLYLSGMIGVAPDGQMPTGLEGQTRQAMANIGRILQNNGLGYDDVFKCSVMLTDMKQWGDFNSVYVSYFKPGRLPARSAFAVSALAKEALVEIECMAYAGPKKDAPQ